METRANNKQIIHNHDNANDEINRENALSEIDQNQPILDLDITPTIPVTNNRPKENIFHLAVKISEETPFSAKRQKQLINEENKKKEKRLESKDRNSQKMLELKENQPGYYAILKENINERNRKQRRSYRIQKNEKRKREGTEVAVRDIQQLKQQIKVNDNLLFFQRETNGPKNKPVDPNSAERFGKKLEKFKFNSRM